MLNVLILEDDPIISMDTKSIVDEVGGFCGFTAYDMQTALKISSKHSINIIISDIQLKGTDDGIEITKRLQSMYGCQAFFLTSFSDEATLKRASTVEFTGYILKPFREEELTANLRLCAMRIINEEPMIDVGGGYVFDKKKALLFLNGEYINLTTKERQLFLMLLRSRGNVVPLSYIDEALWTGDIVADTTRRRLFHRLKGKLAGLSFVSVKSAGYKMES